MSDPSYDMPILQNIYRSLFYYLENHTEKDEDSTSKTVKQLISGLTFVRPSDLDQTQPTPGSNLSPDTPRLALEHINTMQSREFMYGGGYVIPRLWVLNMFVGTSTASARVAEKVTDAEEWLIRAFRHGMEIYIYTWTYGTVGVSGKSDDDIATLRVLNPRIAPQSYVATAQGEQGWIQLTFEGSVRLF